MQSTSNSMLNITGNTACLGDTHKHKQTTMLVLVLILCVVLVLRLHAARSTQHTTRTQRNCVSSLAAAVMRIKNSSSATCSLWRNNIAAPNTNSATKRLLGAPKVDWEQLILELVLDHGFMVTRSIAIAMCMVTALVKQHSNSIHFVSSNLFSFKESATSSAASSSSSTCPPSTCILATLLQFSQFSTMCACHCVHLHMHSMKHISKTTRNQPHNRHTHSPVLAATST